MLRVFGTLVILSACMLLTFSFAVAAAPPNEQGGVEVQATGGTWVAKGMRGGGLQVAGEAQRMLPTAPIFRAESGSCTLLLRIDTLPTTGGAILAAGPLALTKVAGAPYLEFRVGTRAVRKMNYDWKVGRWHHVAISWATGVPAIYVDGTPGGAPYTVPDVAARDGVFLGGGGGTLTMDEIYPSPTALTADSAKRMSQLSLSGKMIVTVPTFTLSKSAKIPTLDGQLAAGEWDDAAMFTNFVHGPTRVAKQTEIWATYDDNNLYLAMRTPVVDSLTANYTKWDDPVFCEDSIEMFFMPNPSGELQYYQMVFNTIGTQFDGRITDEKWNGSWTVKCKADRQWWVAEVAVPFKTIDCLAPKEGFRWKFNVCNAPSQWSQTGSYHNSSQFGILKFSETKPVVQVGAVEKVDGKITIPYRVLGQPGKEMIVKADCYASSGIRPVASDRKVITKDNLTGTLVLDQVNFVDGTLEVTAFEDPSDPIYAQFIGMNKDSFNKLPCLQDRPGDPKPLFRPKPTVEAQPDAPKPDPQPAVKPENDPRPSIDAIEKLLIEQQKWLRNSIGKVTTVPAPWTPMTVGKSVVKCWAKEFNFNKSAGLPQQVQILDADIFAKPMAYVSGTPASGKAEIFVKRSDATNVTLVGRQQFGKVTVTTETSMEYDGFARVEVTLSPETPGAVLDGFTLKLPFKKECAEYYHWWDTCSYGRPAWEVGNFITGKMVSGFEGSVWIGDDDRGFNWFAEAPENWSHPDDKDLTEIIPGAKSTDLLIHMLKGKQTLDKPITLVFGYMATPAKPRRDNWRTWEGSLGQIWGWETVFSAAHTPKNPEVFKQQVKNPKIHPMLSCYFAGTHFVKDGKPTPEQWMWNTLWSTKWDGPRPPMQPMPQANSGTNYIGYHSMAMGSTWPDYYLYKLKEMRETYGLRSVYLDTCIRDVNNPFAGMAWVDKEGKTRGKLDIFAFRDMAKRIYNFIHEDPEATVMMHHSNQVAIPILSFMDMHMNGEHFNTGPHQVGGRNYTDVMPVGTMRACYTLKQWGVVPTFLPEHPASTRNLMGYFWAHDTTLYGAWVDYPLFTEATTAKQSFGMGDVDFLPYWGKNAPAGPQPEKIYISAYPKLDKSAVLLIVANMQKSDTEVRVVLNETSLGIPLRGRTVKATDLEFGGTYEITDGTITLPVRGEDFRMIKVMP